MTFSWSVMDLSMRLVDLVDQHHDDGTDPLLLATRPDVVERWAALSPEEVWTYLRVLAHSHAHDDAYGYHPQVLLTHRPGPGLDFARAMEADARGTELLGEWRPTVPRPSPEAGLVAAVLFVTAGRAQITRLHETGDPATP